MLIRFFLRIFAALALAAAAPMTASAQSNLVLVPDGDPEMATAVTKARASLPTFWKAFEHPDVGEEGFALKVAIKDGSDVEHFWLLDIARNGDKLSGTINNDPGVVDNAQNGERYEFTVDQISHWLYLRNGKMVGNETMRPLLKRMPKAEAEGYRAMYETP